jgi:lantibiotic modifying enzyme
MSQDTQPLESAIHSIFGFIERTAERTETGITWTTIDYENKPQHSISVFNGVGGIPFFLNDYYRRYGNPAALELSHGAMDWCANYTGEHHRRGLHMGQTGAALAALHRAAVLGESPPESSLANARFILNEPPGPVTDLLGGEASNGFYLLKLWAHTGETEFLQGAERCAIFLESQMVRDEHGTYCLCHQHNREGNWARIFLGVAHGISGVAHFLVGLAEQTGNERWANLARELFTTLTRYARTIHGGLNWPATICQADMTRCQWSHGAAGIGLTFLNAYRVLGDAEYLETGIQAAEATYGYGDYRQNYTQCTGLAGSGELLLETYRATGDGKWKDRAVDFAHRCLAYRETTSDGEAWPTDAKGLYSADFDYGASGVGHFLLRVCPPEPIAMPLM